MDGKTLSVLHLNTFGIIHLVRDQFRVSPESPRILSSLRMLNWHLFGIFRHLDLLVHFQLFASSVCLGNFNLIITKKLHAFGNAYAVYVDIN